MALPSSVRSWFSRTPPEPPVLQESPGEPVAVCECNAWHGFMVEVLYPDAVRIRISPGDAASRVLEVIPSTARGVLFHLNASLTQGFIAGDQELAAELARRGQVVLNLGAVDVRKTTLHARCAELGIRSARAEREGALSERLIVKTTLNYGGRPERALREQWGERATQYTRELSDTIDGHLDYRLGTRGELPPSVWVDPTVVVERFLENPDGLFFRVYVVGPAGVVSAVWVDGEIKKLSTNIRRRHNSYYWTTPTGKVVVLGPSTDAAEQALTATRSIARALDIDFVGADCVMDATGEVVVVDVNKTPYWGQPRQSPILSHLRHGFNALMGART